MRFTSALSAGRFGTLGRVNGIITYRLSPFEQKAFAGAFDIGITKMIRRIREKFFIVVPPFIVGYGVYRYGDYLHKKSQRKNPKDYEDDDDFPCS